MSRAATATIVFLVLVIIALLSLQYKGHHQRATSSVGVTRGGQASTDADAATAAAPPGSGLRWTPIVRKSQVA